MKKIAYPEILPERTCPICGKTFFPSSQHVYRDKRMYSKGRRVCSWTCVCKSEQMKEAAKKAKAKKG